MLSTVGHLTMINMMEGPHLKSLAISLIVKGYQTVIALYAMQNALQGGSTVTKWSTHARLDINLGLLQFHAHNVSLILSPTTGFVSPKNHVSFDDFFETIIYQKRGTSVDTTRKVLVGLKSSSQGQPGQMLHT